MPRLDRRVSGRRLRPCGTPFRAGPAVGRSCRTQAELAGALENLVDREIPPEEEFPAVLDLVQRVLAPPGDGGAVLLGELRPQHQRPKLTADRCKLNAPVLKISSILGYR